MQIPRYCALVPVVPGEVHVHFEKMVRLIEHVGIKVFFYRKKKRETSNCLYCIGSRTAMISTSSTFEVASSDNCRLYYL